MPNLLEISVAILAGGFGTRLQSKSNGKPKVLVNVKNHPFLKYILDQLNKAGFKNVVICTGYLSKQVEDAFGKKYKNLNIFYSPEQTPLGTGGSIRHALPYLKSEDILVMNGDSFCDVDFIKFWDFHESKNSQASLVLSYTSDSQHFGKVVLGDNSSIVGFTEKAVDRGNGWVNAGIYLISKSTIEKIPQDKQVSIEKDIFPNLVGQSLYGYKSRQNFIDIGTPENYEKAGEFLPEIEL